jgi:hypothetical protein
MSRWVPPVLMGGGLLCGILAAIGHHFFYASLDQKVVLDQAQQEWNFRIGTGLAFLVKACLASAVGLAYAQILWRILRSRPLTLRGVDAGFSVVHNLWAFTCTELWARGPILVLCALIIW